MTDELVLCPKELKSTVSIFGFVLGSVTLSSVIIVSALLASILGHVKRPGNEAKPWHVLLCHFIISLY